MKSRVSKSRAAVERAQEQASKNKKPVFGRYFVAEPKVMDGGDFPTRTEWLEEQEVKSGNIKASTNFQDSGPKVTQGRK